MDFGVDERLQAGPWEDRLILPPHVAQTARAPISLCSGSYRAAKLHRPNVPGVKSGLESPSEIWHLAQKVTDKPGMDKHRRVNGTVKIH